MTEGITPVSTINKNIELSFLAATVSAGTIEKYRKHFLEYAEYSRKVQADPLSAVTFVGWRSSLCNEPYDNTGKYYSANSINIRLSAVRTVIAAAAEAGYIEPNAAAQFANVKQVPAKARKEHSRPHNRTRVSKEQMRSICEAPPLDRPEHYMHRALLFTLASLGGRITEVVNLKTTDLETTPNGDLLVWVGGKNKTNDEVTPRSISREAWKAIQEWLTVRGYETAYIFTSKQTHEPINRKHGWRLARMYAESVGVEHVKPHDFRRFVGTAIGRVSPKKAQMQLAHKRAETTLDNYVYDTDVAGVTEGLF